MIYILICITIFFATYCHEKKTIRYELYEWTYTHQSSSNVPSNAQSASAFQPFSKPTHMAIEGAQHMAIEGDQKDTTKSDEYKKILSNFIQKTIKPEGAIFKNDSNKFCLSCDNLLANPTSDKTTEKLPVQIALLTACSHILHKSCYDKSQQVSRELMCLCGTESKQTLYFYYPPFDNSHQSTIFPSTEGTFSGLDESQEKPASPKNSSENHQTLDELLPPLDLQKKRNK